MTISSSEGTGCTDHSLACHSQCPGVRLGVQARRGALSSLPQRAGRPGQGHRASSQVARHRGGTSDKSSASGWHPLFLLLGRRVEKTQW